MTRRDGRWQQISKELRGCIFINDTSTVEVDYKGLHVAILSSLNGGSRTTPMPCLTALCPVRHQWNSAGSSRNWC